MTDVGHRLQLCRLDETKTLVTFLDSYQQAFLKLFICVIIRQAELVEAGVCNGQAVVGVCGHYLELGRELREAPWR